MIVFKILLTLLLVGLIVELLWLVSRRRQVRKFMVTHELEPRPAARNNVLIEAGVVLATLITLFWFVLLS
jgi:hypothetical protein